MSRERFVWLPTTAADQQAGVADLAIMLALPAWER
jgi:hypothetical protein